LLESFDREGEVVIDQLVRPRRDKAAVIKLSRILLKGQGFTQRAVRNGPLF
jgi:hypothetical protein